MMATHPVSVAETPPAAIDPAKDSRLVKSIIPRLRKISSRVEELFEYKFEVHPFYVENHYSNLIDCQIVNAKMSMNPGNRQVYNQGLLERFYQTDYDLDVKDSTVVGMTMRMIYGVLCTRTIKPDNPNSFAVANVFKEPTSAELGFIKEVALKAINDKEFSEEDLPKLWLMDFNDK